MHALCEECVSLTFAIKQSADHLEQSRFMFHVQESNFLVTRYRCRCLSRALLHAPRSVFYGSFYSLRWATMYHSNADDPLANFLLVVFYTHSINGYYQLVLQLRDDNDNIDDQSSFVITPHTVD